VTQLAARKGFFFVVLACGLAGLSACVATQQDVLDLEAQTDALKQQIVGLQQTLTSLQSNQADLSEQVKNLHDDLGVYTETIKENEGQMNDLSSKIDDMRSQIASQVLSIGKALTSQQIKSMEAQKAALEKDAKAHANSPTELFNEADIRLGLKNYNLAAQGFHDYLEKFPNGAFADAALYKLARCYYGMKNWKKSGEKFALFLSKYPKNNLIPSARLMYARCLIKIGGKQKEVRQYLESVENDFPGTPEAHAATLEIKRLARRSAKKGKLSQ
jgi:TolA-binding protein